MFGIINQLRRAAVSFVSNIAEGFSRNSYKEKVQFYSIALGSLTEVQSQVLISRDVGYLNADDSRDLELRIDTVNKITNGLLRSTKALASQA